VTSPGPGIAGPCGDVTPEHKGRLLVQHDDLAAKVAMVPNSLEPPARLPVREVRASAPIWRQWNLIWNFAQRDLKSKFKGSTLGWLWSLVVPLATLGIYTAVFSTIMRVPPPPMGHGEKGIFVLWFAIGLTGWSFFSSSINGGISGLIGTGALLKKIYFPAYAPVLGSIVATGVQSLIELSLVLVALLAVGNVGWTWLLLPLVVVIFVVFTTSLTTGLAILNVYVRDMAHLVAVALQMLFYATTIIFPLSMIPVELHGLPLRLLFSVNPLTQFLQLFRDLVYGLTTGSMLQWAYVTVWTAAMLAWAMWVFKRRGGDLGEEL
jgi:ABC-type polysaccharide/polyol phosphate export permease